jgi:hypothetical protein
MLARPSRMKVKDMIHLLSNRQGRGRESQVSNAPAVCTEKVGVGVGERGPNQWREGGRSYRLQELEKVLK